MAQGMIKTAALLGLMVCVGPFAVDMYIPALPQIAGDLNRSEAATQATLSAFFIALGIGQSVYGPWSDQAGRKPPLYAGLALFILGSIGCALAPSLEWLVACRFLQGFGAAGSMVISRAIVRDLHTGTQATRMMATIMLVVSVSPMLAPLAGSLILLAFDWRTIFLVLCGAAVISLILLSTPLSETLDPERRVPVNAATLIRGIRTLVTDPIFVGLTFIGGFGMASVFLFIASGPFVYTGQFGLTPLQFSLAFAFNAIGFFAASQFAAPVGARIGPARTVSLAISGFAALTIGLWALALFDYATLPVIIALLFLANSCLGLVIPTAMVMALDNHGAIAGMASSLGGTIQMLTGGVMVALASPIFDGTAMPMTASIAACGAIAWIIARLVLPGVRRVAARAG